MFKHLKFNIFLQFFFKSIFLNPIIFIIFLQSFYKAKYFFHNYTQIYPKCYLELNKLKIII